MDCNKAGEAMMQYMDKLIKPRKAAALARHVLKCERCRDEFMAFDAAMDYLAPATEADTAAMPVPVLTEAPEGFTDAVMAKVRLLPVYQAATHVTRADIVMRVLWGLCAVLLGFGLIVMSHPEAVASVMSAHPWMVTVSGAIDTAAQFISIKFEQLRLAGSQAGTQTTLTLTGASYLSLAFVGMLASLLVVLRRGENMKA